MRAALICLSGKSNDMRFVSGFRALVFRQEPPQRAVTVIAVLTGAPIALIVVLAGLGMVAALQVGSVASVVLAVVVALTALIVSPAILSIARTRA